MMKISSDNDIKISINEERYLNVLNYHLKPLISLFNDEEITDIEVNPDSSVFVHTISGFSKEIPDLIIPGSSIAAVATLLASKTQNDVTEEAPSVAAIWPSPPMRIHIILPPATIAPCMVIRRFSSIVFPLNHLIEENTCTETQATKLRGLITSRKNIVISGETGSGKTTLLNSLLLEIPKSDRLYIVEDTRELRCFSPNKVQVITGEKYTTRSAIKDALRFRPDRIIVGEVRDGAALDLLEAWNTGHPGGLCSIHANSPATVKQRLKSLIQQVSISPQEALIDITVDAVIQISLCNDGKRRITEIKEFNVGGKNA